MTDAGPLVGTFVERFEIRGRGQVLILKLPETEVPIRIHEEIELRYPDGTVRRSQVAGIETACGPDVDRTLLGILLSPADETGPVPAGTTVWKPA